MNQSPNFFAALTPFQHTRDSFDSRYYRSAPDDWLLAVTDVESSTRAVEAGRYQLVNLAGAAGIAAVRNVCDGETIPFLFGGDGAVLLIPPAHEPQRVQRSRKRFLSCAKPTNSRCALALCRSVTSAVAVAKCWSRATSPHLATHSVFFWAAACNSSKP